ncbi:multisubunit sodium/proton antiporter, MrpG subunit [Natronincola peptidivorans]|uniref:Multisubunit sodium/proton antiporter, MrpG subunit n=1 Tax=Natronincola peptidivorans TaxID=426128 RepID=A0A1I0BIK4_9FIRM|nr:monovalent cation/H(+) antiporter subunit G [Natronincola peptidivorans]SET06817.1 multisubunit sodium/proton antiporter, MrpG subunit [Natronincola peptidivorans]
MQYIQNGLTIFLLISSGFFFLVGTVGLVRMPDAFTRMHATTKCDTLGAGLALLALVVNQGFHIISVKLLLIIGFIWMTNPTAAHIIAKAEYNKQNANLEKQSSVEKG